MDLRTRFNLGYRKIGDDLSLPRRTLPLALCDDWKIIRPVEVKTEKIGLIVERRVQDWCEERRYLRFNLHDEIDNEMRQKHKLKFSCWEYSGNGIGEIRCVDGSKEARLRHFLTMHRLNDPLGEMLMRHVLAFVEGELCALAQRLLPKGGPRR